MTIIARFSLSNVTCPSIFSVLLLMSHMLESDGKGLNNLEVIKVFVFSFVKS